MNDQKNDVIAYNEANFPDLSKYNMDDAIKLTESPWFPGNMKVNDQIKCVFVGIVNEDDENNPGQKKDVAYFKEPREMLVDGEEVKILKDRKASATVIVNTMQNFEPNTPFLITYLGVPEGKKYHNFDIDLLVNKSKPAPANISANPSGVTTAKNDLPFD